MGSRTTSYTLAAVRNAELQIYAERLSGTPTLYLDALILVPANHLYFVEGSQVQASDSYLDVLTNPNDTIDALAWSGDLPDNNVALSATDFYLPVEGSILVFAAERQTSHVLTDSAYVTLDSRARWLSLRNA
jgi:hypothetical protein